MLLKKILTFSWKLCLSISIINVNIWGMEREAKLSVPVSCYPGASKVLQKVVTVEIQKLTNSYSYYTCKLPAEQQQI